MNRHKMNTTRAAIFSLLAAAMLSGCSSTSPAAAEDAAIQSVPLAPRSGTSETLFEKLSPDQSGVEIVNVIDPDHAMHYLFHSGTSCGGVAIGDVDGDGRPDIYLGSTVGTNKLYRQVGDLKFQDDTERAQVDGGGAWTNGVALVDIDGDTDLDIYVCNYDSPNLLYINQGDGTFVDQAEAYRVNLVDSSLMAAFSDYDLDGDLDFYLLTNRYYDPEGYPADPTDYMVVKNDEREVRPDKKKYWFIEYNAAGEWRLHPILAPDRLLRNNGDGTFTDVTEEAGIRGDGDGLSVNWWDYNQDGWPDIYVGNDFDTSDCLYRNNGDGTFTDAIKDAVPHTSWFSMGADSGDLNNDGLVDFLTADMSSTTHFMQKTTMGSMGIKQRFLETAVPRQYMRNALYLNTGTERFMEIAYMTGMADSDWTWSVKMADLDNDGQTDVFFTNGNARNTTDSDANTRIDRRRMGGLNLWDPWKHTPPRRERNLAFRNLGDLRFEDVSKAWGLDHLGMSYGAAHGDLDLDGDLDLVTVNLEEPASVYRNRSKAGHRVSIRLRGTHGNTYGIGARLKLECGSEKQVRELKACSGFMGSDLAQVHFGLGDHPTIDRLVVEWPSGHVQTFENLAVDRFYTITEPEAAPSKRPPTRAKPSPLFLETQRFASAVHKEKKFDDYARQPLLPNRLSQLGPGMAWGDIDGDGDEDVFISGSSGQPGTLVVNQGDKGFRADARLSRFFRDELVFQDDYLSEDMAPLFLDADGDGDLDLYVVSGSVECEPDSALLQDRLYLNNGSGRLTKASSGVLPAVRDSGSAVVAGDFDQDGDLDLFVGGRVIPGKYPLTPRSRLLRNEGGKFVDATEDVAPELAETGLVTGALWSDADNDGWLDLLVTHEWGPIKLFHNRKGQRLVDRTEDAGLSGRSGWWNGIAGRDLDNDGDIDYVVTNFGLNTKYHASPKHPALLYYGDFDGTGKMALVEAEFEGSTLYPIRGKSCSTHAMPMLGERFTTYKDFALAELHEIYSPVCLEDSFRFEANTLESGVLLNDGKGRFAFQPLPRLAQAAPGFGIVLTDVNGDTKTDLLLAQNFFSPQVETGRMDGGLSLLLLGNGDGTFTSVWPDQSGIVVPGDAKCLTTTDLNGDGWPDFVVGINDGKLATFENQNSGKNRIAVVRLRGKPGNPTAVGARVTLHLDDGSHQAAEVYAGGGYLSQSTPQLVYGLGQSAKAERVEVRWPDGQVTASPPSLAEGVILLQWP